MNEDQKTLKMLLDKIKHIKDLAEFATPNNLIYNQAIQCEELLTNYLNKKS